MSVVLHNLVKSIKKNAPFKRQTLINYLEKKKIETRPLMTGNFVEQPVIRLILHFKHGKLPNSKLVMKNSLFFGNHQGIGRLQREYVVQVFAEFIENKIWKKAKNHEIKTENEHKK